MPGRDRSDLRTAEEASAGQWVIVPAFSIRVALRRGNRAPLPRPAVPASPEDNYQCRSELWRFGACLTSCKKPTHLVFLLEDRHEGRQLPYGGLDVCPDKTCQNKPVPF